jgi:tRNA (guanine9-N1)-methyltransferase
VYLTADTETKLDVITDDSIYVIGGLVDKNRHKNICLRRARELELATGRLPISDYVKMAQRQVLAVNHVGEAIIRRIETDDWALALKEVIPQRRLYVKSKKQKEQRSSAADTSTSLAVTESLASKDACEDDYSGNEIFMHFYSLQGSDVDEILMRAALGYIKNMFN